MARVTTQSEAPPLVTRCVCVRIANHVLEWPKLFVILRHPKDVSNDRQRSMMLTHESRMECHTSLEDMLGVKVARFVKRFVMTRLMNNGIQNLNVMFLGSVSFRACKNLTQSLPKPNHCNEFGTLIRQMFAPKLA